MAVTKIDEAAYSQPMQDILNCFTNCCLSYPNLTMGSGSKAAVLLSNTIAYVIDGVMRSKTTAEVALSGIDQATATACIYLISINASGTLACTQGTIVASTATPTVPALPSASAPIGYVTIVNTSGSDFDPGTTLLDASGIGDTYTHLFTMATAS